MEGDQNKHAGDLEVGDTLDQVSVEKKLSELKALRASTKGSLTRTKKLIVSKGDSLSATELNCRLGILESYFKQVLNVQLSIEKFNIKEEEIANDAFRGEVEELCLTGTALGAVKEFDLLGANYRKALERLETRFDNKRLIFQEHINMLLEIPKLSKATSSSLRNLEDSFNTHLSAMLSIGNYEDITNAILISLAVDRLDVETRCKWHDAIDYSQLPSWNEFTKVLDRQCRNLEIKESKTICLESSSSGSAARGDRRNYFRNSGEGHSRQARSTTLTTHDMQCAYCNSEAHSIEECAEFQSLSVARRFHETKRLLLCINCLQKGHSVRRCSNTKCSICSLPHHQLLHRFPDGTGTASEQISSLQSTLLGRTKNQVILATALIEVRDRSGSYHPVRAILDSASQLNFITEHMAQRLRLVKTKSEMQISGIGKEISRIHNTTLATCKSRVTNFVTELKLLVIKNITDPQPSSSFEVDSWRIPNNITLADPEFNKVSKIDMLIGAECFFELLAIGQIRIERGPTLQKTLFGWVVSGRYEASLVPNATVCLLSGQEDSGDTRLNEMVEQFWKIERIDDKKEFLSPEEEKCEAHFVQNVDRDRDGRFVVRLPFKQDPSVLGDSVYIAKKRFLALEKRLKRMPEVREQYIQFMKEYEDLGHMKEISDNTGSAVKYLCPHQCVLRPDSSSTKLRVVFDCSARTSSNISLNEVLLKGPVIQDTLFSIILRFRLHKYALTADISKMYRQILVDKRDRQYQCILWRNNSTENLKIFQLNTVTYGTTSAPFLATRCLKMLADSKRTEFPLGSKVLSHDFYMDDLISGGDSAKEIIDIYSQVKTILKGAGFDLRKWWTNEETLLTGIPEDQREIPLRINDADIIKTLGIKWNPSLDQLQYMVPELNFVKKITKRVILSELSALFDPLGLINPVIVKGKIILQSLWVKKINWDESVQARIFSEWEMFRSHLKELETVRIPRYVLVQNPKRIQIHGFADASLRAYGCCIYIRAVDQDNEVCCYLLSAKSRVAPIKTESIPRLELCAAEMLVGLIVKVIPNLGNVVDDIFLWTDSEIVLCWLSAHPSTWEVFVANRVSKIQTELPSAFWRHVSTTQNPADIVSRGAYASELLDSIWFRGPQFLYMPENSWPEKDLSKVEKNIPGRRKGDVVLLTTKISTEFTECYTRFNDFQKTCRIFSYVLRFIEKLKKGKRDAGSKHEISIFTSSYTMQYLSPTELNDALTRILWHIQQKAFKEEIDSLTTENLISPKSCVKNLSPFLDTNSLPLLRVGGRLQNADIPYPVKYPILLPKANVFVKNLVVYLHRKNYHAGPQALVGIIRQRFWVIDVRRLAKKVVDSCYHCFKYRPKMLSQIMGNLPSDRMHVGRPFLKTGVDFCGPFHATLKRRGQRSYKVYVAVFVCFSVKAVHLEVVSDLSSQGFIAALKRFVARRGLCQDLFCDNGTNFVGARNELAEFRRQFLEQQTQSEIASWCAAEQVQFHHIPPRAPHFGGLWEAAVKSAKNHLFRTVGQAYLTFEELSTVVADIEAILNSRPLCVMSNDPSDESVLTPGHFLIGAPLNAVAEPLVESSKVSGLGRWRRLTEIKQHFWKRWAKEYLLELQRRAKWKSSSANIKLGTVVLISDDNIPPQQWLLGKVSELISSPDGKVRVVNLKTKNGTLRRAIHRLAPLPEDS